jgi:transposase
MELSIKTVPYADTKPATLFVALELSKAHWVVALHAPDVDKLGLHRTVGGDTDRFVDVDRDKEGARAKGTEAPGARRVLL